MNPTIRSRPFSSPLSIRSRWVSFLGIRVQALLSSDLVEVMKKRIASRERCVIANHNLHSLYLYHHDEAMRKFHSMADFTHVDGMSLIVLGRLFRLPLARHNRTGYMDLLPELMKAAVAHGWRVFYLGSRPGVAKRAADLLRKQYPGIQIETRSGYFDAASDGIENNDVLTHIRRYAPDVLLVGMGMPRQEDWILNNLHQIEAQVLLCSGALMDYVAGEIPTPPRWLGQVGLEWLYRLISEPRRLYYRYLVEPWFVMALAVRELLSSRSHAAKHCGAVRSGEKEIISLGYDESAALADRDPAKRRE